MRQAPADASDRLPGALTGSWLAAAGLVQAEPRGRFICYRADFDAMRELLGFLTENCCGGNPDACAPMACGPADTTKGGR